MKFSIKKNLTLIVLTSILGITSATSLPKYDLEDMNYLGAFRMPAATYGEGRVAWSEGKIAVDLLNQTFFFSGSNKVTIAEFELPETLSNAKTVAELKIIPPPKQGFTRIFDRSETGNINKVDRITGLSLIDGKLVVSTAVYYDAGGTNDHTTLVIDNPENLAASTVRGFLKLEGKHRAAGWISKIPDNYKNIFNGDLIAGNASNLPINGRSSMGPSAYVLDQASLDQAKAGEQISTTPLLYFTINNWLDPDPSNITLENDTWTELSYAEYGFIIPGTSTYFTIGSSAGHESGVGYKITQENGYKCGGFCANDFKDYYSYYWLWDVNDLIDVHEGLKQPYDIKPYEKGRLELPFQTPTNPNRSPNRLNGATYTDDGRLYIVLDGADTIQSDFETLPVILVYDLFSNRIVSPTNLRATTQ